MPRPRDTSPDALDRQRDALRHMTPSERLELAARLTDEVRAMTEAGVKTRHPSLSQAEVDAEVREIVARAADRGSSGMSRRCST